MIGTPPTDFVAATPHSLLPISRSRRCIAEASSGVFSAFSRKRFAAATCPSSAEHAIGDSGASVNGLPPVASGIVLAGSIGAKRWTSWNNNVAPSNGGTAMSPASQYACSFSTSPASMSSERFAAIPLPIVSVSAAVQVRKLDAVSSNSVYSGGSVAAPLCTAAIHWFTPSA